MMDKNIENEIGNIADKYIAIMEEGIHLHINNTSGDKENSYVLFTGYTGYGNIFVVHEKGNNAIVEIHFHLQNGQEEVVTAINSVLTKRFFIKFEKDIDVLTFYDLLYENKIILSYKKDEGWVQNE